MNDIRMDKKCSKKKMRKCKFYNRLDYSKLECKIKKESAMEENKTRIPLKESQS